MDTSYETTSFTENSSLLDKSPTPIIFDRDIPTNTRESIFTCAVVFILFTELCERLTFYSIQGNLVLFATEREHLDMTPAIASILSYVFAGTYFAVPVLGGWLADSKVGKLFVILFGAIVYLFGTLLLALGSIARDDKNAEHSQWAANNVTTNPTFVKAVYITGLILVGFGAGGFKTNILLFGAEQASHRGSAAIPAFYLWVYWFGNIGSLLALTFVVYLQQNFSFFYGNLVPACSLILALIIFLSGKRAYASRPPAGPIHTNTLNIVKEAIKRSRRPSLSSSFLDDWLDRAKLCFGGSYSSWEVEDVKKVYRLLPVFGSFILYWTIYFQINTAMIYQGEYMDIQINGFVFPVALISVLDVVAVLAFVPMMDKLVYPLLAKFELRPSQLQRIGFGMIIATASVACAGGVEWYRVNQCCMYQHRPGDDNENVTQVSNITILYQMPQYALMGLSEVFTAVTGLELAFTEAPQCFQGVTMGVFLLTIGLGNVAGAALLVIVNAITEAKNGVDGKWYPDKKYINKSPYLAYYFFLLAGLMCLNFIVYVFVAVSYKKRKESASRCSGVIKVGKKAGLLRKNEPDYGCWTVPAANNSRH